MSYTVVMKNLILMLSLVLTSLSLSLSALAIEEREPIPVKKKEDEKPNVEKASGDVEWLAKRDVWSNIHFKAALDHLSYKSLDKEFSLEWSIEVGNVDKDDKEYLLSYSHSYSRQADLFSGEVVRNTEVEVAQDFDVNKIEGRIGWTTHFSLTQMKENNVFVQKYNIEVAPVGIKYDIYENDKVSELSLSYLPTYNYLEHYKPGVSGFDKGIEQSLLHVVKLSFEYNVNNFTLMNELAWKKIKAYDDAIKAQRDYIVTNDFQISYQIFGSFSVSYNNELTVDKRRKSFQGLPSTDHRNGISFAFEWN